MKGTCGTFIYKKCVEIDDWRTSAHLYWSFKKTSWKPYICFYLFLILVIKKEKPLKPRFFLILRLLNSDLLTSVSDSKKRYTQTIVNAANASGLFCLVRGKKFTLEKEVFAWRIRDKSNYRDLNIKETLSQF